MYYYIIFVFYIVVVVVVVVVVVRSVVLNHYTLLRLGVEDSVLPQPIIRPLPARSRSL